MSRNVKTEEKKINKRKEKDGKKNAITIDEEGNEKKDDRQKKKHKKEN